MASDDKEKKWGTIYLDAGREATLSKLDDMQAASRQEQWNQRTQNDYLEKVRAKATERAREILGEAYTERQRVIEEAQEDARRIRLEAQMEFGKAEEILAEAKTTRENAQGELDDACAVRNAAQEDGFNAGLHQAQQELESFRAAMGASVAGVLQAIEGQCMAIFTGWREEMTALLKVCVEKGTSLVLDEQYQLVLEHLVLEAVRQLDDRRCITLRVHPDDEAAVADMFAAAKEKFPNLGQWMVTGDPALELGGLIAESQSGSVDSRLELFRELVDNILEHLTLPGSALDNAALLAVEEATRQEAAQIAAIAPPLPQETQELAPGTAPDIPPDVLSDNAATVTPDAAPDAAPSPNEATAQPEEEAEGALPPTPDISDPSLLLDEAAVASALQAAEAQSFAPAQEEHADPEPASQRGGPAVYHEPSREELEEELLPIPPDTAPAPPSPLDEILAGGGFLEPSLSPPGKEQA